MENTGHNINLSRYGECKLMSGRYDNDRLALQLFSTIGELVATITVNLPDEPLEDGELFVKGWSENEWMIPELLESGIFQDTGKRVPTGHVEAFVWRFADGAVRAQEIRRTR